MSQTSQEKNKALVLEAFDRLFNKRDYTAAERFWSPNYVQHSAHIAPAPRPRRLPPDDRADLPLRLDPGRSPLHGGGRAGRQDRRHPLILRFRESSHGHATAVHPISHG
jgi:hypothetical protein